MAARCHLRARRCNLCPGVGRKTANVVLNMWWRMPAQAVDTHIFRVGNRTGICPGRDVDTVERAIEDNIPAEYQLHAPSLADPARALHLQGAQALVQHLPDPRPVPIRGKDPMKTYQIAGIGNAIVDVIATVDDRFSGTDGYSQGNHATD